MKKILLLLCMVVFFTTGYAQDKFTYQTNDEPDFQFRTGFSIDKKLVNKLHLTWSEELRMKDLSRKVDRIYSFLTLSYEICPYLKAAADYTFIAVSQDEGWELRHRTNLDLTGSYKVGDRWKFSLRERFRMTWADKESDPVFESNPTWIMRSRLMAEYTIFSAPVKPYIYMEFSNTLNAPAFLANFMDKLRTSVGVKYALSKRSEFDFYYRFDYNRAKEITPLQGDLYQITTDRQFNHILGVFYEYSF